MKQLLALLLIAPSLLAQQQQATPASSISIPFEKYTLNNGLTVKNCRFARKVAGGKDDRGIAVGPIVPVAR